MIELRGLTWAHTRGFAPLAALGRTWEDFHPDERVTWTARSLWSFGEEPLKRYLDEYDLFVYDYPFAGEALEQRWIIPLEKLLTSEELSERRSGTISPLYDAFTVDGSQTALPIDVATHVAASRMDLLAELGESLPRDWGETLSLARRTKKVAMPLRPTGVWGAFLTLCANAGDKPFHRADERAFDVGLAGETLSRLRALALAVDPSCFEVYPVPLLNRMDSTNDIAFVPLTYGYSTYGARGYAPHRLSFHNLRNGGGHAHGAILGGAGIGVSAGSKNPQAAARHAAWLTSDSVQGTTYVAFGGQPASRAAWNDPVNDGLTNGFFSNVRASAENAYVRPNAPGFHDFQNLAAGRLHEVVTKGGAISQALNEVLSAWSALKTRQRR